MTKTVHDIYQWKNLFNGGLRFQSHTRTHALGFDFFNELFPIICDIRDINIITLIISLQKKKKNYGKNLTNL